MYEMVSLIRAVNGHHTLRGSLGLSLYRLPLLPRYMTTCLQFQLSNFQYQSYQRNQLFLLGFPATTLYTYQILYLYLHR